METFQTLKMFIIEHAGLEKDALHIYVSIVVFVIACVVLRAKASSWKPWLVVLLAAFAGEGFDYQRNLAAGGEFGWDEHWKDIWNTMLVPTGLVLLARYTGLFEREAKLDKSDPDLLNHPNA